MKRVAVLSSGGLDSSVLIADYARSHRVYPIYVRAGLTWEAAELKSLRSFLGALGSPNVNPVKVLRMPVGSLYGNHWSVTGRRVPRANETGRTVFMPGRNILLLCPTAVWCSMNGVHHILTASLNENSFADATPEFFRSLGDSLSKGMEYRVSIEAPYSGLTKKDLIARNGGLPLHLTLTCIAPLDGKHCGTCHKCHERHSAFVKAGVEDRTAYNVLPELQNG